jgi:hypothetical protein
MISELEPPCSAARATRGKIDTSNATEIRKAKKKLKGVSKKRELKKKLKRYLKDLVRKKTIA